MLVSQGTVFGGSFFLRGSLSVRFNLRAGGVSHSQRLDQSRRVHALHEEGSRAGSHCKFLRFGVGRDEDYSGARIRCLQSSSDFRTVSPGMF